jgi:hypothetical protein
MTHGGCRGFTNVVLTEVDGKIVLDSRATGACVIEFAETQATAVRDQLRGKCGGDERQNPAARMEDQKERASQLLPTLQGQTTRSEELGTWTS